MRLKISKGNTKLGGIPNLNLPPVITCPTGTPCTKDCYALKAWKQYPNVRSAWSSNLEFYNENRDEYFNDLLVYVVENKPKLIRIHSAGDMPDEAYWFALRNMAAMTPNTQYLVFTKRYNFNYEYIHPNISLVLSIWPGLALPNNKDLPWAWLYEDERRPDDTYYFLCPGSCADCSVCWNKLSADVHVCFKKH